MQWWPFINHMKIWCNGEWVLPIYISNVMGSCRIWFHEYSIPLQRRNNGCDGVSNQWFLDCFHNCLFRCKSKKKSKLRVTGLCKGNSPVTGEFPAQRPVTRKMFPFHDVIMRLCVFHRQNRGRLLLMTSSCHFRRKWFALCTDLKMLFWRNCHHSQYRRLSKWQVSAEWQLVFIVG